MDVRELEFDEANEEHLARHGIRTREVRQILENRFLTRRNPKSPDGILVLGRTNGGRYLTVVMAPTSDPVRWRPITGWDSDVEERRLIRKYVEE